MDNSAETLARLKSAIGVSIGVVMMATAAYAGGLANEEAIQPAAAYAAPQPAMNLPDVASDADSLYIGDDGLNLNSSIRRFNAKTGKYLGEFVAGGSGGLHGPRGLIFTRDELYVVNQNVNLPLNGEILRYRERTGAFLGKLVSSDDQNSPFSPRGIIRGLGRTVYVANYVPDDNFSGPGWIGQFDAETGTFRRHLDTTGFSAGFWPRGIVFGPDGLIYVSVTGNRAAGDDQSGYVLRFNPYTGKFVDTFASFDGLIRKASDQRCAKHLHRPEGLVFGPDRKLYITAFRADPSDTDKILVLDGRSGKCLDYIDLAPSEASGGSRVYGEAILFGPGGRLFFSAVNTGEVRRYNVKNKRYEVFVPPCGPSPCLLTNPWYMTFGRTNPRTLDYDE
jgi:WD40 repeat protein